MLPVFLGPLKTKTACTLPKEQSINKQASVEQYCVSKILKFLKSSNFRPYALRFLFFWKLKDPSKSVSQASTYHVWLVTNFAFFFLTFCFQLNSLSAHLCLAAGCIWRPLLPLLPPIVLHHMKWMQRRRRPCCCGCTPSPLTPPLRGSWPWPRWLIRAEGLLRGGQGGHDKANLA